MTISSSLAAGVAGLNSNAQRLASISDNIANSATFGYKRVETDFHSMVIQSGTNNSYTAGGVRMTSQRMIDERGPLVGTANSTDVTVAGRGFLAVTNSTDLDQSGGFPTQLITTGSFRPNSEGVLTNATGQVLLGWPAQTDGSFPAFPRDSTDGLMPINVYHNQYSPNPTTEITMGLNLPAADTDTTGSGAAQELSLEYWGNLGQTETLGFTFTPTIDPAGRTNEWTVEITDTASAGAVIAEYTLVFDESAGAGGTLASVTAVTGGAYDPVNGTIPLTVGGGAIDLEIGTIGDTSGITQLEAAFAPSNLSKNGSSVGNLLGVEISPGGIVMGVYDSGFTRPIYQVPVIDVPNQNGLNAMDNQTYQVSLESGSMFLWDAGEGPTGETIGYAREASTTDVAVELTQLIQTQRAYSSNAKVIQTVDEMLQETTNLKR